MPATLSAGLKVIATESNEESRDMFSDALDDMDTRALIEGCIRELQNYKRGEPSNGEYSLALFHRALMQRDSLAWEGVQQCFVHLMYQWLYCHPLRRVAYRLESDENYVAQGFARFWQATADNRQITFPALGAALKYLRVSLHAVIVDTLRSYARASIVGLPADDETGMLACEDEYETGELWQTIRQLLPDERQRRVAYLLYHCGLKPREIVQFCEQEFNDIEEIYRLRRNIIDRLRRNADLLCKRSGYGSPYGTA